MKRSLAAVLGALILGGVFLIFRVPPQPMVSLPENPYELLNIPFLATSDDLAHPIQVDQEFDCVKGGTYWVHVRYSKSLKEIHALVPVGLPLGKPVVTALGTGVEVRVHEVATNKEVTPEKIQWVQIEASTKESKIASDRFDIPLRNDTRYRLQITIPHASATWISLDPTCVVEMSHALRAR